jgi:hypothetical protein
MIITTTTTTTPTTIIKWLFLNCIFNDYILRTLQCVYASSMHCKDPAVSVRKSQDTGNIQKPACTKGYIWEWCANGSTDQSHLRMRHLLRTGQNIGKVPRAFDEWMCVLYKCLISQSINETLTLRRSPICRGLSSASLARCSVQLKMSRKRRTSLCMPIFFRHLST